MEDAEYEQDIERIGACIRYAKEHGGQQMPFRVPIIYERKENPMQINSLEEFTELVQKYNPAEILVGNELFGFLWNRVHPNERLNRQKISYGPATVHNVDFKEGAGTLDLTGETPVMKE